MFVFVHKRFYYHLGMDKKFAAGLKPVKTFKLLLKLIVPTWLIFMSQWKKWQLFGPHPFIYEIGILNSFITYSREITDLRNVVLNV